VFRIVWYHTKNVGYNPLIHNGSNNFPTELLLSRDKATCISGQYLHMECGVTSCLHLPDVLKYMLIICYDVFFIYFLNIMSIRNDIVKYKFL